MAAADLAVEARGVHKFYGSQHVLHGIDLEVRRGQVVVVVGPSGSGKSTLLRCLNHLETVQRGSIRVCGELVGYRETARGPVELRDAEAARHRRRIGMVFQQFNLFPHRTVLQNVTMAPERVLGDGAQAQRADRDAQLRTRDHERNLVHRAQRRAGPAAGGGQRFHYRPPGRDEGKLATHE